MLGVAPFWLSHFIRSKGYNPMPGIILYISGSVLFLIAITRWGEGQATKHLFLSLLVSVLLLIGIAMVYLLRGPTEAALMNEEYYHRFSCAETISSELDTIKTAMICPKCGEITSIG